MSFFAVPKPLSFFKLDNLRNYQFKDEGNYLTSPNYPSLPTPVPVRPRSQPSGLPACDIRDRPWEMELYPYAAFVHKSPFFGPLMSRFSAPVSEIPLVHSSTGWHLHRETAKSWKSFEHTTRAIASQLSSYIRTQTGLGRVFWDEPIKPGTYGYFDVGETEQEFRSFLRLSVDAFAVFAGYLSFLIAVIRYNPLRAQGSPSSLEEIFAAAKVNHTAEYPRALLQSGIGDFNLLRSRVGLIVDVTCCRWLNLVPVLINARVPVWLAWGQPPFTFSPNSWISAFVPCVTQAIDTPKPPDVPSNFPPVLPHSGQKPGETWQTFFARRAEIYRNRVYSDAQVQKRLAKEKQMAKQEYPVPKSKIPVFFWENVDGHLIRTRLTRHEATTQWGCFTRSQRQYDSFSDQWDLCYEFSSDPNELAEDESSDSDSDYEQNSRAFSPTRDRLQLKDEMHLGDESQADRQEERPPTPVTYMLVDNNANDLVNPVSSEAEPFPVKSAENLTPTPANSMLVDNDADDDVDPKKLLDLSRKDFLLANPISSEPEPLSALESVENLVYFRYGFFFSQEPYQGLPAGFATIKKDPFHHWGTVCRAVGGQGISSSQSSRAPITDFVLSLFNAERPFHDVPGQYWDLSWINARPLKTQVSHLRIEVKRFVGKTLCLLRPHAVPPIRDTSWCVAVQPMTALECVRRDLGPHSLDVLDFLADNGIEFHTLQLSSPRNVSSRNGPTTHRPLLGCRPWGYEFDLADFASYETIRDSYLLAQPFARCALSKGGIVARLAREVLPNSVLYSGPSEEALNGQHSIFRCEEDIFVDDDLADAALDLICGTYEVGTGHGTQKSHRSWFPRANAWAVSGLNSGIWNEDCEDWFVMRWKEIHSGKGKPLSSTEWRSKLKMSRQTTVLTHKLNIAALDFLESSQGDSLTV